MGERNWMNGPPRKILLATDLSARCDRALDRAASLAEEWGAQLVVLHVLESDAAAISEFAPWRRRRDPVALARRQLIEDVGAVAEKAVLVIEQGRPADAIRRVVEAEGCDLVVTGVARDELLGRFSLGSTVDRLLRSSAVPLLVVKSRARRAYRQVVVATDLSPSSRHALEAAVKFFPEQTLSLFHAYEPPPLESAAPDPVSYRMDYLATLREECQAFVQGAEKPVEGWQEPEIVLEEGDPADLLREFVIDRGADLVALGSHGRSALFEMFLGSVAQRIMESLSCDALLVREPRARADV